MLKDIRNIWNHFFNTKKDKRTNRFIRWTKNLAPLFKNLRKAKMKSGEEIREQERVKFRIFRCFIASLESDFPKQTLLKYVQNYFQLYFEFFVRSEYG